MQEEDIIERARSGWRGQLHAKGNVALLFLEVRHVPPLFTQSGQPARGNFETKFQKTTNFDNIKCEDFFFFNEKSLPMTL